MSRPKELPTDKVVGRRNQRGVDELRHRGPSTWVYVGTWPTDDYTTLDSPPWQNGWAHAGDPYDRVAFRWDEHGRLEFKGHATGGSAATVAFTLPDEYRPDSALTTTDVGTTAAGSPVPTTALVATTGEVALSPLVTGGPISALGLAFSRSQAMSGNVLNLMFDSVYCDDASFSFEEVTSGRAQYVTISQEGWYRVDSMVYWDTDFSAGDFPFFRRTCFIAGVQDILDSSAAVFASAGSAGITHLQNTTAEMDHHELGGSFFFNFTAADFGQASLGIGLRIDANVDRTKAFGGELAITRLGDTLAELTIA